MPVPDAAQTGHQELNERTRALKKFNQPASGLVVPRFGGIATFMRLPHVTLDEAKDLDIGLVGIPWDGGTTNRPGPRHGATADARPVLHGAADAPDHPYRSL